MEEPIGVGLAAFGMSGRVFHAPLLTAHHRFRIRAVMRRSSTEPLPLHPHISLAKTIDELLNDERIQLVIVNTPDASHYQLAKQSLEAGKHVVVEKPFTQTSEQARELIAIAKRVNRVLTVFQNRRWDGDFLTVQQVIREEMLGRLVDYESHWDRYRNFIQPNTWKEKADSASGLLQNLGSHLIDHALALFGLPEAVTAHLRTVRTGGSVVDWYHVRLHYPAVGVLLSSSYLAREPAPRFVLHGTLGSFVKHGLDPQEAALAGGAVPGSANWGKEPEELWGLLSLEKTQERKRLPTIAGNYLAFYDNLYEAITQSASLAVRPEDAARVIEIIEAAQRSNNERRTVCLSGI